MRTLRILLALTACLALIMAAWTRIKPERGTEPNSSPRAPTAPLNEQHDENVTTAASLTITQNSSEDLPLGDDPDDLDGYAEHLGKDLAQATADTIGERMRSAHTQHNDIDFEIAKNQLLTRSKAGDGQALAALVQLLQDADLALRIRVAKTLGEIATPDALSALLSLARSDIPVVLRRAVLVAVGDTGKWLDRDKPADPLTALLLGYLDSIPSQDASALVATSRGLASLGTPDGVARIFQLLESLPGDEGSADATRKQLLQTLGEVRSPSAIPVLAANLLADLENVPERGRVAGTALSMMGQPQATSVLLDWAATITNRKASELAIRWLSAVRDPKSLDLLLRVEERQNFRDPTLRSRLHEVALALQRQATPH